ncbi:MAG: transcriptional regulator, XRE family [uncultured bacterium]|nr:MAG: transcriptional regulator, XRE family [uncultured bacterium]
MEKNKEKLSQSNSLGDYLKATRLGLEMTLRQVEEATDREISNAYLSQLETGKITKPSPHTLYALSQVYDVSYENLMERAGYIMSSNAATQKRDAKHGQTATLSIDHLSREEEKALLEYLAFLRQKKK